MPPSSIRPFVRGRRSGGCPVPSGSGAGGAGATGQVVAGVATVVSLSAVFWPRTAVALNMRNTPEMSGCRKGMIHPSWFMAGMDVDSSVDEDPNRAQWDRSVPGQPGNRVARKGP